MEFVDHAHLPGPELDALRTLLTPLTSLQAVVRWAFALRPPSDVAEVIVQDEYTHDVVVPWRQPVFLVFDTT